MKDNKFRNIAIAIILCIATMLAAVSCGNQPKPPAESVKPNESGDVTTSTPPETEDDDEKYYYNPRIDNAYIKNDHTILFTIDTAVKDPDGNLYQHIYIASEPDGEPIAYAKSAESYDVEHDLSKVFGAEFDVTLPEKCWLCFAELSGEGNGDGDLETVLCDVVSLGIYADKKLADGRRIAAFETTDNVINAVKWTQFPFADVSFVAPHEGDDVPEGEQSNRVERDILIEGQTICTTVFDRDGYCEFTFTGSGLRLAMLCNIQDGGKTCYNVPALIMYLDGEEYATISMTDPNKYYWKNAPDIVFEDTSIPYGTHTVRFVNTTEGDFTSRYAYYCGIYITE